MYMGGAVSIGEGVVADPNIWSSTRSALGTASVGNPLTDRHSLVIRSAIKRLLVRAHCAGYLPANIVHFLFRLLRLRSA